MLNPFFEWCIGFARDVRFGYAWRVDVWMFSFWVRGRGILETLRFSGSPGTVKLVLTNSVIDEYLNSYYARY